MDLSGIDPTIGSALIELGTSLSTLVLKGTTTAVQGKIASLKNEKMLIQYAELIMKWLIN